MQTKFDKSILSKWPPSSEGISRRKFNNMIVIDPSLMRLGLQQK